MRRLAPLLAAAIALPAAILAADEPQLQLVHLAGPPTNAAIDALKDAGVTVLDYLRDDSYLVWGDPGALARLDSLAAIASRVPWSAERKLPAGALSRPAAASSGLWAVQLYDDPAANGATLSMIASQRTGPELFRMHVLRYLDLVVPLPEAAVAALAARPDVVSVQPWFEPRRLGERDAQIVAGNLSGTSPSGPGYLSWLAGKGFTQAQFTASGFRVDISDSGVDNGSTSPDHPGLRVGGTSGGASRVGYMWLVGSPSYQSTDQGCDGHGTISAHVLAGYDAASGAPHTDGSGYHYGLGVCPFVTIGSSVIFDPWAFTHPDLPTLASQAWNGGARLSSNGWGMATSGGYDVYAQAYDAFVRDAEPAGSPYAASGNQEMVYLFAAGNAGPGSGITSPGTAKNVITVGAAEGVQSFGGADQCGVDDTLASSANDMLPASSRGPTADGRAKPDLVAPGTHVSGGVPQASSPASTGTALACYAGNDATSLAICGGNGSLPAALYWPETGQQLYTASSGTSMSVAMVAGAAALLRQRFLNQGLAAPSPAMTKAVLVNSARYLTGAGAADTLPSPAQGMGEVNLGAALDRVGGTATILRDEAGADLLTASGQTRTFSGSVADTTKPFRVTLAWTDAPGSTAGNAWNNDLNLTVAVGGTTYKGNVFSGASSVAGGSADARNNVESVFLPAGTGGSFTVTVTGASINSDGVPGNGISLDQDFALVVYNATTGGTCTPPAAPSVGSNSPVCAGSSISLTASGAAGAAYSWTGPNGFTSTAQNPTIPNATTANGGTYSVTQTVSGCTSASASVNVTVASPPTSPGPSSNSPVTVGQTIQLTAATVSGGTYHWTGPNGFTSTLQNPTVANATPAAGGTYSVTVTAPPCSGSATGSTSVSIRSAATKLYAVPPCRVVDTRNATGPYGGPSLAAGSIRSFALGGQCGVPVDAVSVTANVTIVFPSSAGQLEVFPAGSSVPVSSVLSFPAGAVRANNAVLFLTGSPGTASVKDDQPSGTADLVIDVSGYYR